MNYLHQNLLPFSPWHFYFSPYKSAAHVRLHVGWLLFFCEASFQVLEFPILRRCYALIRTSSLGVTITSFPSFSFLTHILGDPECHYFVSANLGRQEPPLRPITY